MKSFALITASLLTGCSLVFPASDHQGGTPRDAGADMTMPDDMTMSVDAGPECTQDSDCDPEGAIACVSGACTFCYAPMVVATGTPASAHPIMPLHSLIVPAAAGSSDSRLIVSYAAGDHAGDVPSLIRMAIDDTMFGTTADDAFPVLSALSPDDRTGIAQLFGFAMNVDRRAGATDSTVYWTSYAVSSGAGMTQSRFVAHGDFFSNVPHAAVSNDAAVAETFLAEPAVLMMGATPTYVARTHSEAIPVAPTNSLRGFANGGGAQTNYTGPEVPAAFSELSASGNLAAMGVKDSTDVLVWNPATPDGPLVVPVASRTSRAVLATEDSVTYYLAYAAASTLSVLRAECPGDPSACSFTRFASVALPSTDMISMPAIQVLGGHVFVATRESTNDENRVVLRAFDTDGSVFPASGDDVLGGNVIRIDTRAPAIGYDDVALSVIGGGASAARLVVSYLRNGSSASSPNVIAIARLRSCHS